MELDKKHFYNKVQEKINHINELKISKENKQILIDHIHSWASTTMYTYKLEGIYTNLGDK